MKYRKRLIFLISVVIAVAVWLLPNALVVSGMGDLSNMAEQSFILINQERSSKGIHPLAWDNELEQKAVQWSSYMTNTEDYRHSDCNLTENITYGFNDYKELYEMWRDSSVHHANMMDSSLTHGAIGIAWKLYQVKLGDKRLTYLTGRPYATFLAGR
jgi:uncharacterized protein YkwD